MPPCETPEAGTGGHGQLEGCNRNLRPKAAVANNNPTPNLCLNFVQIMVDIEQMIYYNVLLPVYKITGQNMENGLSVIMHLVIGIGYLLLCV